MMYGSRQKKCSHVPSPFNFCAVAALVRFQTFPILSQGQPSVLVNSPDGRIKKSLVINSAGKMCRYFLITQLDDLTVCCMIYCYFCFSFPLFHYLFIHLDLQEVSW